MLNRLFFLLLFSLGAAQAGDCDSDVNGDGVVDAADSLAVQINWGLPCDNCPTDTDNDGGTTLLDIFAVMAAQGAECLPPLPTDLAGNALSQYPFFEYVLAFNEGQSFDVAVDTSLFPQLVGVSADVYVVESKTFDEWTNNSTLTDVTGGFQTETFSAGSITLNTFTISGSDSLSSAAGLGVGHAYDMVVDVNQNGSLDGGDLIDGFSDPAEYADERNGLYVVHDLTLPGPLVPVETSYSATAGTVTAGFEGENIFYPANIASMGQLPLLVISHGNGHNFNWYDHLGNHMASYGYVVMSHANNTVPGVFTASTTTLEHVDAFIEQLANIDGGILTGHVDTSRMVWLGHSRGGEGVAIAVDRIFDGEWEPRNYSLDDLALVSSIAPVDFLTLEQTDPHGVNYHLWTGGSDNDVNGCADCNLCQTFHLHDRATDYRQSISLHGVGHGDFHNGGGSSVATGPCLVGRDSTHLIMKGYFLPLVKHYVEGNIPGRDFLWRQWEQFKPISAPNDPCVVVDLMYREAPGANFQVIDDFQGAVDPATSSTGGAVTFTVTDLGEGRMDDADGTFTDSADPMNGMTGGGAGVSGGPDDDTAGVVFSFNADMFYEQGITPALQDFSGFNYLHFRAAQATRHPNTTADLEDLTFDVTLTDGGGQSSTINIGAYGGGIEEPYQRTACGAGAGWANEFESIRIRLADFLINDSQLDLSDIASIRFDFGPSHGSPVGRIGIDDIGLSADDQPPAPGRLTMAAASVYPTLMPPGMATNLDVSIAGVNENLVPGSAMFHYRLNGGPFVAAAASSLGGDLYRGVLPAVACGDTPEFYFTAEGDVNGAIALPRSAPFEVFSPAVGVDTVFYTENLDSDPGWATEGLWAYGQNSGGGGSSGSPDPVNAATGTMLYGYNLAGDYENNLGEVHLTSGSINCSGVDNVQLSFWRWLGVESSQYDHAYVRVSNDGGATWTDVYENGGNVADASWSQFSYDISALAAGQASVMLRWTMGVSDNTVQYCGWNIDDVTLSAISCP